MREILFRGKRVDNGEWVEGELLHKTDGKPYIFNDGSLAGYEVLPETVGQYTGLKDKKGVRIFEGDFVQDGTVNEPEVVEYGNVYGFSAYEDSTLAGTGYAIAIDDINTLLVTGNIHDNPELLK